MSHHCDRCADAHAASVERRTRLVRAPHRALASTRALLSSRPARRGRGWAEELAAERLGKPMLVRVASPSALHHR